MNSHSRRPVIIHWGISSFFGWGIYGLNLALNWSQDRDLEPVTSFPLQADQIVVDPLRRRALNGFFAASADLARKIEAESATTLTVNTPLLAGLGNDFTTSPGPKGVQLSGSPTLGVVFFELPQLSEEARARARGLKLVIAGSTWNERIMRAHGLTNVTTVIQGVDQTLFHPGPRQGVLSDRFLVFSGGKLELRKGQDLVVAAFARFAKRHPEALLVTAWHSPWPQFALTLNRSGKAAAIGTNDKGVIDHAAWIAANDIDARQFLDLGSVPNALMPPILREMDVAVFPNRSEGGTNLVAMECMACGVPTILSANTGHLDLIDGGNCYALQAQAPVAGEGAGVGDVVGWGESSVDEIEDALERAWRDRNDARRRGERGAAKLAGFTWSRTADQMKSIIKSYI
ncbi:glycosyltransferase family 4 protein [Rhizobium paknamense]|uniref:Glycosyltransferase involved in cell wall biosynthesis n=1 Tax=Rhizobium paknamense TaxID=1206817 RepID=A0ABU0ID55_9HYPH|nr:glycosyltransferase family 4 protein [Rhizobium paknamense]MDQ0456180.1 glycosyltransferase involved in cell wall biosynthesis [Rhizobium paknamense]